MLLLFISPTCLAMLSPQPVKAASAARAALANAARRIPRMPVIGIAPVGFENGKRRGARDRGPRGRGPAAGSAIGRDGVAVRTVAEAVEQAGAVAPTGVTTIPD